MVVCGYTSIDAFFRLWVCLFACLTLNVIGNTLWKTIKYLKVIISLYDLFFPQKHSPPILHCLHILLFSCHVFIFFYLIFLLYNTVLVLPYIDMNPPQVYMSSQPWTPLPSPSPYHLSGSSQCNNPKHPVSCIESRLVIHFLHDSIHVFLMSWAAGGRMAQWTIRGQGRSYPPGSLLTSAEHLTPLQRKDLGWIDLTH